METSTLWKLPGRLNADSLLIGAGAASIGILVAMIVVQSVWLLAVLVPALITCHLWWHRIRTQSDGAVRLDTAITAILARHEASLGRSFRPARIPAGRLHLLSKPTD